MKIHIVKDDGTVVETIDDSDIGNVDRRLAREVLMDEIAEAVKRGRREEREEREKNTGK